MRKRQRWFGFGVALALVGLICAFTSTGAVAKVAAEPGAGAGAASASASGAARGPEALARATGTRVLIPSLTTANSQTFANPNGSRTLEMSVKPVRQRTATGWAPISSPTVPHSAVAAPVTSPVARPAVTVPPGMTGWAEVYGKAYAGNTYWGGDGDACGCAKVGLAYGQTNILVRSYFQFGIGSLAGKHIESAKAIFDEVYAPSCTSHEPTQVDMYSTGAINSGLTWSNQPSNTFTLLGWATVAYGYNNSTCAANTISTNAISAVVGGLNNGTNVATFMLKADDETNQYAWKKFQPSPTLTVTYDSPPDAPGNLTAGNPNSGGTIGCSDHADAPYVSTETPSLHTTITDADGGSLMAAHFQWWIGGTSTMIGEATTPYAGAGAPESETVPAGAFSDGQYLAWHVQGINGDGTAGPWSPWCEMIVDVTPPNEPPTITSSVYQEVTPTGQGTSSGSVGQTAPFTFTANGVPDVAGFVYCTEATVQVTKPGGGQCDPTTYVAANQVGGSATANITPLTYGPTELYVASVDRAGNQGSVYHSDQGVAQPMEGYHFIVGSGAPPVGVWHMDNFGGLANVPDSSGNHHDGTSTVPNYAYWGAGRIGESLHLVGSPGAVTTSGPVLHTNTSLTVSAWVKLDGTDGNSHVVATQDGNQVGGFYLEYRADLNAWVFMMTTGDVANPGGDQAVANAPVQTGVWTHLVGEYDSGAGQLSIFVNGRLAGTAAHTSAWDAGGPFAIGRDKWNGSLTDYFLGSIDEVRVYQQVLPATSSGDGRDDVADLADGNAVQEAFLPLNDGSGANVEDASGNYFNGALSGGYSWTHGHASVNAIHFDESTSQVATSAPVVRTDGSFTVSAEVKLDQLDSNWQTLVSEDGQHASLFSLQECPDKARWCFSVAPTDTQNPAWQTVYSTTAPQAGVWTQLTGVYDAATQSLSIYVDGGPLADNTQAVVSPPQAGLTGNLVIGRGRQNDTNLAYLGGAVDDVHVYEGVLGGNQINAEYQQELQHKVPGPANPYPNELVSYYQAGVGHFTTSGPAPQGYYSEGLFGLVVPVGTANTRVLYSCEYDAGQFVSAQSNCEETPTLTTRVLSVIGAVYISAPPGIPSQAVYRCLVISSGDHFVAADPNCYSNSNYRPEGQLGYVEAYATLSRFLKTDAPADHAMATSTLLVSPGATFAYSLANYPFEKTLGLLSLTASGDVPVFDCVNGADEYLVTGSTGNCGTGAQSINWIGNMWSTQPQATATAPLYDCRMADGSGERFDSNQPDCEGQSVIGLLGYVITQP